MPHNEMSSVVTNCKTYTLQIQQGDLATRYAMFVFVESEPIFLLVIKHYPLNHTVTLRGSVGIVLNN